jgi:hypothetical protein
MMKSLTAWRVDKPLAQPYLCKTSVGGDGAYFAALLAIEPWIAEFPLIWRMPLRIGACAAVRHNELIGNPVDHAMAATPNRKDRNLV